MLINLSLHQVKRIAIYKSASVWIKQKTSWNINLKLHVTYYNLNTHVTFYEILLKFTYPYRTILPRTYIFVCTCLYLLLLIMDTIKWRKICTQLIKNYIEESISYTNYDRIMSTEFKSEINKLFLSLTILTTHSREIVLNLLHVLLV